MKKVKYVVGPQESLCALVNLQLSGEAFVKIENIGFRNFTGMNIASKFGGWVERHNNGKAESAYFFPAQTVLSAALLAKMELAGYVISGKTVRRPGEGKIFTSRKRHETWMTALDKVIRKLENISMEVRYQANRPAVSQGHQKKRQSQKPLVRNHYAFLYRDHGHGNTAVAAR